MELYSYKAVDAQGKLTQGRVNAVNVVDLEVRLKRLGMDLIRYKVVGRPLPFTVHHKITRRDQISFFYHLLQLLDAGVPIREALSDLRDSVDNTHLRDIAAAMIESIDGGKSLSEAMRDFVHVFENVTVSLIKVGEDSGQLSRVLTNIIESLRWQDEQAAHLKKLLLYPSFVGAVVLGVILFMMFYLVPELVRFVQQMGLPLPLQTRILIVVSGALVEYWYMLFIVPPVLVLLFFMALHVSPPLRTRLDATLLKVPGIGRMWKKIILARFANYFAIMYASGINILDCIRAGEEIVGNRAVEQAIRAAGRQIADGVGLSKSFQATGLFPPLVLRMLHVGETTGTLDRALQNVGYFYTRDVREAIERVQTMIEPMLTVVLGLIMGWVILSVLGPIYDLVTKIKI